MSGPVDKIRPGPDGSAVTPPRSPRRTPDLVVTSEISPRDRIIARHIEVIKGLEPMARKWLSTRDFLMPRGEAWQPSDYLPELETEGWEDRLRELREGAKGLSPGILVVLVGDTVTEEALPTYAGWLARVPAIGDETGVDQSAWGIWNRGWNSEENNHGLLLNSYLRLSGRVNMHAVEQTIKALINNGFNPQVGDDPYNFFVYTAFQERATNISHSRVGDIARAEGVLDLAAINDRVGLDEKRHEAWYTSIMREIIKKDPEGGVIAFADMLKKGIVMPAAFMTEGEAVPEGTKQSDLFSQYADVAQKIGVYTAEDYLKIIKHLYKVWGIARLNLTGEAAKAQDDIARRIRVYERGLDRAMSQVHAAQPENFPWIKRRS